MRFSVSRAIPDLSKGLRYAFSAKAPAPGVYPPGSPEFRYWTAADALRRGADFWARVTRISQWQPGSTLAVKLDEGEDLNAYYDREALNFFHGPGAAGGTVYSGESPDVLCHEMGHAILDALKPELWDAAGFEPAAFHEAFGDISAILSAIQLPSLRTAILNETGGHPGRSSRLSRLAEQLGSALRVSAPDAVDADCLRNAVNSFSYGNPASLPSQAPATQLSSEPHSFSRPFTGAIFEILAALTVHRAKGAHPGENDLLLAGDDVAHIIVAGIANAPVTSNWYAQAAAAMVQASTSVDPTYPAILKGVFVRRAILSLHSAAQLHQFAAAAAGFAAATAATGISSPAEMALPADHYGLDAPVLVNAPSGPPPFTAMGMVSHEQLEPPSAAEAARTFVDDLFRRGRVITASKAIRISSWPTFVVGTAIG